jgi:glycosyltransferase involved in cell wall biosynthesis
MDSVTERELHYWEGLEVEHSRRGGFAETLLANELADILLSQPVDLVHLHGIWGPAARAAARVDSTPIVLSPHGMLDPWARKRSRLKKLVSRSIWEDRLFSRVTAFHALNVAEAEAIREIGYRGRVEIVPNGTDLPELSSKDVNILNEIEGSRHTLLFLGRLHPKKGLAELVAAWGRVSPDVRARWHLKIVGWDELGIRRDLEKLAQSTGVSGDILFSEPVFGEAKDAVFRQADAFILPSYSEGLPMAVLEAWSYALPVFMTRECNIPEGFMRNAAVEITTAPTLIADLLERELPYRSNLCSIGKNGRRLVEGSFSWDAVAKAMLDLYRDCVVPA